MDIFEKVDYILAHVRKELDDFMRTYGFVPEDVFYKHFTKVGDGSNKNYVVNGPYGGESIGVKEELICKEFEGTSDAVIFLLTENGRLYLHNPQDCTVYNRDFDDPNMFRCMYFCSVRFAPIKSSRGTEEIREVILGGGRIINATEEGVEAILLHSPDENDSTLFVDVVKSDGAVSRFYKISSVYFKEGLS